MRIFKKFKKCFKRLIAIKKLLKNIPIGINLERFCRAFSKSSSSDFRLSDFLYDAVSLGNFLVICPRIGSIDLTSSITLISSFEIKTEHFGSSIS
jgi:hypothetical protein